MTSPSSILRAQDRTAPLHVPNWARMAEMLGCPKSLEAEALACLMEESQRRNPDKIKWPD